MMVSKFGISKLPMADFQASMLNFRGVKHVGVLQVDTSDDGKVSFDEFLGLSRRGNLGRTTPRKTTWNILTMSSGVFV